MATTETVWVVCMYYPHEGNSPPEKVFRTREAAGEWVNHAPNYQKYNGKGRVPGWEIYELPIEGD